MSINRFVDGQRTSIGDHYVDIAIKTLDRHLAVECAMFVPKLDRRALIPMLFDDVAIEKLRDAMPHAAESEMARGYELAPHVNATLGFDWEGMGIFPAGRITPHMGRYAPFMAAVRSVQDLRHKWGAVKHTLRWCNRHLTPGAIRNLWPSAMALCPTSPAMIEIQREAPVRYTSPAQLGDYLPLLRYTAGVVAASKMLPSDVEPRKREGIWLTFPFGQATVEGCTVDLDGSVLNLG